MRLRITGDKSHGHHVEQWRGMGQWRQLSHHDSRERAEQAKDRQECAALINGLKKPNAA